MRVPDPVGSWSNLPVRDEIRAGIDDFAILSLAFLPTPGPLERLERLCKASAKSLQSFLGHWTPQNSSIILRSYKGSKRPTLNAQRRTLQFRRRVDHWALSLER